MHRVDSQVTGLASRLRFAPFADGHLHGACLVVWIQPASPMPSRRFRNSQMPPRGSASAGTRRWWYPIPVPESSWSPVRSAFVRFIHLGQQFHVGPREAALEKRWRRWLDSFTSLCSR